MKVLSIGNSFSQDAQRYLQRLAKQAGVTMKTVNLVIGGCPLRKHYLNVLDENAAYGLEFNGESTGFTVSIRQALVSDEWDVVTLQQASTFSWDYNTYQPYLNTVVEYVKKYAPRAKIYIHETWAYENGSERLSKINGYTQSKQMYADIKKAYAKAAKDACADGIIPSGRAMLRATELGDVKMHRDTFHASLGVGRYLLALTWLKTLTGTDISQNDFNDFDVVVTDEERKIAIDAVEWAVKTLKK